MKIPRSQQKKFDALEDMSMDEIKTAARTHYHMPKGYTRSKRKRVRALYMSRLVNAAIARMLFDEILAAVEGELGPSPLAALFQEPSGTLSVS